MDSDARIDALGARAPGWPIAASILWGVLVLPGLGAAMMSPMIFDAPGSLQDRSLVLLAGAVVAFPLLCVVSIAATWVLWGVLRSHRDARATAVLAASFGLPLLPAILVAAVAAFHHG